MAADPFAQLRRGYRPVWPGTPFALRLLRQLEAEAGAVAPAAAPHPTTTRPQMVHLGVPDADRAMGLFTDVLGWESERVAYGGVRHYVVNTTVVTPCILEEPDAPPVSLGFEVDDLAATRQQVREMGGTVVEEQVAPDNSGFVMVRDDQGVPLQLWSRRDPHLHPATSRRAGGDLAQVRLVVPDLDRALRFYGHVLRWSFDEEEAAGRGAVADHARALGVEIRQAEGPARIELSFAVADLDAAAARVRRRGGQVSDPYPLGPLEEAVDCQCIEGPRFSLTSAARGR